MTMRFLDYVLPVGEIAQRVAAGDMVLAVTEREMNVGAEHLRARLFADCVLAGVPVTGIVLRRLRDGRLVVLDGNKRLRALIDLLSGALQPMGTLGVTELTVPAKRQLRRVMCATVEVPVDTPEDEVQALAATLRKLG